MTAAAHATALDSWRPPPARGVALALAAGLAVLGGCAGVGLAYPRPFFQAWLFAFLFWWMASLGCLGLTLIHNLTGGKWGDAIRPFLLAGVGTLLPLVALFVPLLFGLEKIYTWGNFTEFAAHGQDDPVLAPKAVWFGRGFVYGRAAGYFLLWFLAAAIARRGSRLPSAVMLAALVLTASFAATDWAMSLDLHWFSTIYGGLYVAGAMVVALAISVASLAGLAPDRAAADPRAAEVLNDLGNLLLAFIMLWTYFSLSQFLIIWSGNLPEETVWYIARSRGAWRWLSVAVFALNFAAPFLLLLSRDLKRRPQTMCALAAGLIAVRTLDLLWLVAPSFTEQGPGAIVLDFAALAGMGGIWGAAFGWSLQASARHERPHGKRTSKRKGAAA